MYELGSFGLAMLLHDVSQVQPCKRSRASHIHIVTLSHCVFSASSSTKQFSRGKGGCACGNFEQRGVLHFKQSSNDIAVKGKR